MKTKKLVLGFTFVLAAAFIAPVVAYMSNEPGTIIDIKDFRGNTFETALLSDEPGTVIDIKDFRGNTFETALMTDEPGTVIDIKDFRGNSFETALINDETLNVNTIVVDSVDIEALS